MFDSSPSLRGWRAATVCVAEYWMERSPGPCSLHCVVLGSALEIDLVLPVESVEQLCQVISAAMGVPNNTQLLPLLETQI